MRPEQKIIMSCRQTGERAERLLEWLDQSRIMLKAQERALRTNVQGISNELLTLVEAVEQPPTAGVIGAWGSARGELINALMSETQTVANDDDARPSLSRERIAALMPRDDDGGAAARIRFVAAERAESPFRFPIRMTLLSQLDLVKVLASAYLLHVPPGRQRLPRPDVIAQNLTAKAQEVVHQAFSGMSRRDIDTLRDTLHANAPESPALRQLDAGGYWDVLGGMIPHLPETLRRRVFALLWGEDPAVTALFERLSDAIELLGFSGEIFGGLDGLVGRDPATGWMMRHPDSVIATTTILAGVNRPDRMVRVSSRHGRSVDVERFILAALVDDVHLPVASANLQLLETGDVLVLPAPRPVLLWPNLRTGEAGIRPKLQALTSAEALEIFAAQKATHQADQAVRRHALTSLLVAADYIDRQGGSTELDAASTAQIANWIEMTQGETPHARERRRTGIAILAADGGVGGAVDPRNEIRVDLRADARTDPRSDAAGTAEGGDTRLAKTISSVLEGNTDWAHEWTPNRPFRNVFSWRPPRAISVAASGAGQPGSADILRFERIKGAETAGVAAPAGDVSASYDLVNLQHAIAQSTTTTIHLQQVAARLADLRRALAARFLRLHMSNDPSSLVEWRRQICHVARNRLEQSAQSGGFGRLQRALMFSEGEAHAVLARLKTEAPTHRGATAQDLRTSDASRVVGSCLEAWIAAMRQSARSPVLMRAVNVPGQIVAHMVDELVIGALRIGLQEKLSEAVRRIQLSAPRAIDCDQSVAALMERGINAYVETLDPGARALRGAVHREARFGGVNPLGGSLTGGRMRGDGARTDAARGPGAGGPGAGGNARRTAHGTASAIADDWAETFTDLIEANVLGASLLGGAGHLNRELGDVLSAISSGPFEGHS